MTGRTDAFINEVKNNLEENILKFWIDKMQDPNGGFFGQMTGEEEILEDSPKGAIQNARILWAFSAAYRILKKKEYLMVATRAKDYFIEHFIDNKYGGVYWSVNANGSRLNKRKHLYAIGFGVYALSEYVRATNDENILKYAVNIYETLEKEGLDPENGGYVEAKDRDWGETNDYKLCDKDPEARKTMRTQLHILESFTNLYRVWPNDNLRKNIINLLDLFNEKLIDPETGHLGLFFDEKWNKIENSYSYGYDIEASWILLEAALIVKDIDRINKTRHVAQSLGQAALKGLQPDGSFTNMVCDGKECTCRQWWVQAEAVIGALWMWKYLNIKDGADIAINCWNYAATNLVDEEHGEWFWACKMDGTPNKEKDKVNFLKSPYHNSRMCFEVLEMLG